MRLRRDGGSPAGGRQISHVAAAAELELKDASLDIIAARLGAEVISKILEAGDGSVTPRHGGLRRMQRCSTDCHISGAHR